MTDHALLMCKHFLFSLDEILLLRNINWTTYFTGKRFMSRGKPKKTTHCCKVIRTAHKKISNLENKVISRPIFN